MSNPINSVRVTPPLLKRGDKVAVVAPAKKLSIEELNAAVSVLKAWGLQIAPGANVITNDHSYLSATDQKRLRDLQEAIDNPDIRAIFCARGGYGCTRIIDELDFTSLRESPKWLVGFSDITALLTAASNNGVMCVHGTMPVQFGKENWRPSTEQLRNVLFNGMSELSAAPSAWNRLGVGSGVLVGGNLSILADSIGTISEVITKGCILLLEEIDEDLYRLDRMLTHLKRTGKFDALSGLAIGHISDLRDTSNFQQRFEEIVQDKVRKHSYPVGWGLPFGHENPNFAWVVGQHATLRVDENGTLLSPAPTVV
jgi:muramoyltetrapeptide carboxypeptidase